jgi:demethylmenaquinone methyltransferase/2-methoxy-6-polyprenyl-1,4-benzoquinol methylase
MALDKHALRALYRKRAKRYDLSANLYYLVGFREAKYRQMAVARLALKPGDTVVELGCGTGLNFGYLRRHIGHTGQLIGVDLTDAMLQQAQRRIDAHEWHNVTLVQGDAAQYAFPAGLNGVFSSFALTLVPEYAAVIGHAWRALAPGGRLVILDLKQPDTWPLWVTKLGVALTSPFGVTLDLKDRKPWEVMERHFRQVTVTELYGGFVYIAVGEK